MALFHILSHPNFSRVAKEIGIKNSQIVFNQNFWRGVHNNVFLILCRQNLLNGNTLITSVLMI